MTLALHEVEVSFGRTVVLQGITFEPVEGEVTVVLGRNAAGKSTLLRTLAGLVRPRSGSVLLDGSPIASLAPADRARRLAYLPQHPDVVGPFTVADIVSLGSLARPGADRGTDALERVLDQVGLLDEAARAYHELSAGQRQRAALARCLLQLSPEGWLLLDEPLAAQDPGEAARIIEILRGLKASGHGILVVVHDPIAAWPLGDRAAVLESGRLRVEGEREAILEPRLLESVFGVPFIEGPAGPIPGLGDRMA